MTEPSPLRVHNYLDSSSLDPLATSLGDENADPQPYAHSSPTRLPQSSPHKGMRVVEDFSFSSPHGANRRKSNAPNSPSRKVSYQNLSPWKIRVTVEAEPEEAGMPTRQTTTRTAKVPLRDDSATTEFATGKGRKSQVGSSGTKRRSTTFRGARSSSRSRRQSVTDLDITVLGDEEDLNEWSPHKSKKRGRPRSKKDKQHEAQQAVLGEPSKSPADGQDVGGSHNGLTDSMFQIRPDSDAEDPPPGLGAMEQGSPELRRIDLNRVSVRSRSTAAKGHKGRHRKADSNTSPPTIQPPALVLETSSANSGATATGYPTPTSSVQDEVDDDGQSLPGDPKEHHAGFDTILESEGFTMIDLDSIPSARHFVSPPREQEQEKAIQVETPANKPNCHNSHLTPAPAMGLPPMLSPAERSNSKPRLTAIPAYLSLLEGESELSSTIPSSPPAPPQAVTLPQSEAAPLQTRPTPLPYSSPSLPSPPRANAGPSRTQLTQPQKSTTPKLARVVRAGIALQGVLSPKTASERPQANSPRGTQGTPKQRLDDLFEGFDSGTRRELRAGLRFGEELAKRQKASSPAEIEKKTTKVAASETQVWRGETTVQHTPTALPADTSDMIDKRTCPTSTTASAEVKRAKATDGYPQDRLTTPLRAKGRLTNSAYLDTQAKERQWQLERAAVSKQIQNANTSQVIIISSDGVDEDADGSAASDRPSRCPGEDETEVGDVDETCGDIWLAEAEAHNSSQHHTEEPLPDIFPPAEQQRQKERAREVVNRPRRALIPSPWKRGEDIDGASTFATNSDLSGLLWQHASGGLRFGAGVIKRQAQGNSNAFGSGSQGTPFRTRETSEDANPLLGWTTNSPAAATDERTAEDEALGDGELTTDEIGIEQDEQNGEEDEASDFVDESAVEIEDHNQSHADERGTHEDTSNQNDSSLPPQPIKIPVNFNDSTMSALPLTPSSPSSSPQSSRPSTPRSALKGSRPNLGLEENGTKKVVFSSQSVCVDEHGQKSNSRIKSVSPTPPPSTVPGAVDCLRPTLPLPTLSRGIVEPEREPAPAPAPEPASKSWFGWFFGSSKVSSSNRESPPSLELAASSTGIAGVDGSSDDADADPAWVTTKSNIVEARWNSPKGKKGLPSFLRPPSYPSDPTRDVTVPLATSGEFTDVHFRTLHIIYRKSLRRSFHAPAAIRPGLQKMVGEKFSCDEGEYGHFAWEVDRDAVVVVERFMVEVEWGWEGKGDVAWRWSERELCGRLFRIIVGEEVRREQSWRRDHEEEPKMAVGVTA